MSNERLKYGTRTYALERLGTTSLFTTAEEAIAAYQLMVKGDEVKIYKDFDTGLWKEGV